MIKPEHDLPEVHQFELPGLSRSTAYYRLEPTSEADLKTPYAVSLAVPALNLRFIVA